MVTKPIAHMGCLDRYASPPLSLNSNLNQSLVRDDNQAEALLESRWHWHTVSVPPTGDVVNGMSTSGLSVITVLRRRMRVPLPPAISEILLLDGEVTSCLTPNKSLNLKMSPLCCSSRTALRYLSLNLKGSSHHPWQRRFD